VIAKLKPEQKEKWRELKAELDRFKELHPGPLPLASAVVDVSAAAPKTHLLNRGRSDSPQEEVQPGFLQILDPAPARIAPPQGANSTGRRTALANILANPENPLTARVMVNRIWHYHFGRGLVETPSDFGAQGARPTHPALLDWLATEFVNPRLDSAPGGSGPQSRPEVSGVEPWSIKHMHRLIMTSSAYRQSSGYNEVAARLDPDDKLLWRFPRRRLEGESIRDSALAIAGLLNTRRGGPSVFPELPPGMAARGGWKMTAEETERNRRSVYVFVKRNTRYPMFETFDMPDTHESCPRRNITTSPVQALTLLNSELSLGWAREFAGRVLQLAGPSLSREIETAFLLAYCRPPDTREKQLAREFFRQQEALLTKKTGEDEKPTLPANLPPWCKETRAATLVDLCHMLMNANEFVFIN
jgi:hypothetical protein